MIDTKDDYVVLSTENGALPRTSPKGFDFGTEITEVALSSESLSARDVSELEDDPNVLALARNMPLTLIKPYNYSAGEEEAPVTSNPEDLTWGIQATGANTSKEDGRGIVVAVLDTGIDANHPAFSNIDVSTYSRNFTNECPEDINGHGTHCAGTIFGRDVGGQRIGVARGIEQAIICKVLGEGGGDSNSLAEAILWSMKKGANIISMSLGIDFSGMVSRLVTQHEMGIAPATSMALRAYRDNVNLFTRLSEYVRSLDQFGNGALIVAASGNASRKPRYEIDVEPPAASPGVLAVGALQPGPNGMKTASFSNIGCDIVAPGVRVLSAEANSNNLTEMSGTSMATPHVAGVAALYAQRQKEESDQVTGLNLQARLLGMATRQHLDSGVTTAEVGAGAVIAP